MGTLLLMAACFWALALATLATFTTWVVYRVRKKPTTPSYAAIFFCSLILVFSAFMAMFAMTGAEHTIPR
jgi:hypothetical protein